MQAALDKQHHLLSLILNACAELLPATPRQPCSPRPAIPHWRHQISPSSQTPFSTDPRALGKAASVTPAKPPQVAASPPPYNTTNSPSPADSQVLGLAGLVTGHPPEVPTRKGRTLPAVTPTYPTVRDSSGKGGGVGEAVALKGAGAGGGHSDGRLPWSARPNGRPAAAAAAAAHATGSMSRRLMSRPAPIPALASGRDGCNGGGADSPDATTTAAPPEFCPASGDSVSGGGGRASGGPGALAELLMHLTIPHWGVSRPPSASNMRQRLSGTATAGAGGAASSPVPGGGNGVGTRPQLLEPATLFSHAAARSVGQAAQAHESGVHGSRR